MKAQLKKNIKQQFPSLLTTLTLEWMGYGGERMSSGACGNRRTLTLLISRT
jgi:hypothetical protein